MSAEGLIARGSGVFELIGRVTFETVPQLAARGADWLNDGAGAVTVDLGKVALADSAGLALMLELSQQARAVKRELRFVNAPDQLRRLARVSGLHGVFGSE